MTSKITIAVTVFVLTFCIWYALTHTYRMRNDTTQTTTENTYTEQATLGGTPVTIARAASKDEQMKGLSGQKSIGENQGLLFVFETEGYKGIWMKDMLFPIDVLWLDSNMKVVHIKENFLPESYPASESSPVLSRFVLEVQSGFVGKQGIKIGDVLSLKESM